ncbi:efflux RND transporter periplasmic adaptor subunit [Mitsuaria sp. WAJ17]|uniref:efflux RND transporter periplasmic adaptor subunit n=1 Tax=Mitsuaria sp. WAJ17 TaxID=2761452 RepID=UPI0015FED195|nr:efflux RND transporter periplasmic adaptor subunit [Mitsuaria sp. WAJ17]MBB2487272.1 efflux RND transporter periplasmic adaptor subunit [Mitsuaria sp. WAJ17]
MNAHPPLPLHATSGAGMDRSLPPSRWQRWRRTAWLLLPAAAALAWALAPEGLRVPSQDLQLASVQRAPFRDDIALRAQLQPQQQLMIDTTEGGRVEAVLVRDGQPLHAGQALVQLSNPQREQEVLARTAEVAQQLANLSTLRAAQAGAQAQWRRELAQRRHELALAAEEAERQQALATQGFVAPLAERTARRHAELQRQLLQQAEQDSQAELQVRAQTVNAMERAVQGLSDGLALVRQAAERLTVRAPADGQLSGFSLQPGSVIRPGERLGRIEDLRSWLLSAEVDEFYDARVHPGLSGTLMHGGKPWPLLLHERQASVQQGRFKVAFTFAGAAPEGLRPGQSFEIGLRLGAPAEALCLPTGAYLADGGGSSVYVLDPDGRHARRRAVQLGRRSSTQVEVLGGLRAGEQVLVGPTAAYEGHAVLRLSGPTADADRQPLH